MDVLDVDDVMTVRRRLATGDSAGIDFGATEPLRPNELDSAVSRQTVGLGSKRKYNTISEVAATLFYGLAQNHAFENGNKRTAMVAMLVLLQKNRVMFANVAEDELYEMATTVTAHTFPIADGKRRDSDSEVEAIAAWIEERTRPLVRGDKSMNFNEFKAQLEEQGCEFGPPSKNFVKIYRTTPAGTLSVRIGYPRANFTVNVHDVKRVRRTLGLDEAHGIDSAAFYDDVAAVVDHFVNTHRQLLDRLALT